MRTATTDQTGRLPRLIRVFTGRTCHFVGFVMRLLICLSTVEQNDLIKNITNTHILVILFFQEAHP